MSKGTVHQIAAGGFGTGTNDLVRAFLLSPLFYPGTVAHDG